MLIVFVHGVNTRSPVLPDDIRAFIMRYLAPPRKSERIEITYTYWGDLGGQFRFGGCSRPRTRYFGQGMADGADLGLLSGFPDLVAELPLPENTEEAAVSPTGYVKPGPVTSSAATAVRISSLPHDEVTEYLLGLVYTADAGDDAFRASLAIAIDDAVSNESLWTEMEQCQDIDAELEVLHRAVLNHLEQTVPPTYVSQGKGRVRKFFDSAGEGLRRAGSYPSYTLSKVLAELRPKLDGLLEDFFGDVFVYLASRKPDPARPISKDPDREKRIDSRLLTAVDATAGPIPRRLILDLIEAHGGRSDPAEPLILITHSMGGQIAYDVLSWFLPAISRELKGAGVSAEEIEQLVPVVDYWCATASQVGLFEELDLFLASDPKAYPGNKPIPRPARFLRGWWNVWDYNDLLSYTVEGIFSDVDDSAFNSGRSLGGAHSGYLQDPTFYKKLAKKLKDHFSVRP
jgi:hypothetical protein